jgi:general nucleoside transport system ATP-binding protein
LKPLPQTADRETATSASETALELRKVSKSFGAIVANREVDLRIRPGEIRGIVGENGAGKSTLMAIASGLYTPDAGQVLVNGVEQDFHGRDAAIALGVNMVHQHFMLVLNCTVAQNVVLGQTGKGPWLHLRRVEEEVRELADRYGLEVDPRAVVEELSPTQRQRVEILTALWRGRTVLILDEPTSVLGPADIEQLFATMRHVAGEGCAVIFTSHKLREVVEVCDEISVMRHGELRTTVTREQADVDTLATLMVGKDLAARADSASLLIREEVGEREPEAARGGARTVLRMLAETNGDAHAAFGKLTVASGEIVGVAGVEGNGQRQLAETLAGLIRIEGCRVELDGTDVTGLGPRERASLGIAYVPEDAATTALILGFPVVWNLALRHYRERDAGRRGLSMNVDRLMTHASDAIESFDIRGANPLTRTAQLSGGNRQKVALARELDGNPTLLVVVDPTAGLDVGAAQTVHKALRDHRDRGAGIILISTDLDEIEAMSDRIAVLYRGAVVGVLERRASDRRKLGLMMTGLSGSKAARGVERHDVS